MSDQSETVSNRPVASRFLVSSLFTNGPVSVTDDVMWERAFKKFAGFPSIENARSCLRYRMNALLSGYIPWPAPTASTNWAIQTSILQLIPVSSG